MHLEATVTRDELLALIEQLAPLKIVLGTQGNDERSLTLGAPRDVMLVAGAGLRFTCKAVVSWPVLGMALPVSLHALSVLLRPKIATRNGREVLAFQIEIEQADLAGVPAFFDEKITERINRALSERGVEFAWDFMRTLSLSAKLPDALIPVEHFNLQVTHGEVDIRASELRLRIHFAANITRSGLQVLT